MPLTGKGKKIMTNMKKQYGGKKGKQVFYASINKGTISGAEKKSLDVLCKEIGVSPMVVKTAAANMQKLSMRLPPGLITRGVGAAAHAAPAAAAAAHAAPAAARPGFWQGGVRNILGGAKDIVAGTGKYIGSGMTGQAIKVLQGMGQTVDPAVLAALKTLRAQHASQALGGFGRIGRGTLKVAPVAGIGGAGYMLGGGGSGKNDATEYGAGYTDYEDSDVQDADKMFLNYLMSKNNSEAYRAGFMEKLAQSAGGRFANRTYMSPASTDNANGSSRTVASTLLGNVGSGIYNGLTGTQNPAAWLGGLGGPNRHQMAYGNRLQSDTAAMRARRQASQKRVAGYGQAASQRDVARRNQQFDMNRNERANLSGAGFTLKPGGGIDYSKSTAPGIAKPNQLLAATPAQPKPPTPAAPPPMFQQRPTGIFSGGKQWQAPAAGQMNNYLASLQKGQQPQQQPQQQPSLLAANRAPQPKPI